MTTLTMKQAAYQVGLAYRTFRREWPVMVKLQGFPNPFRDRRPYRWDAELVREWRVYRSRPANDLQPAPIAGHAPDTDTAARARARFQAERMG